MGSQDGISRYVVEASPAHYIVKIQSFSLLTKNSIEIYESGRFEAGGHKWKLVLYPSGNKSKNVKEHISLYLALDESSSLLRPGWEIYVNFKLFLYDQNNDNYLVVQDAAKKERRFHKLKAEWGFDQFIPLKDFNLSSKGYLVDDTCVLGAEVCLCRESNKGKGESLIMTKDALSYWHGIGESLIMMKDAPSNWHFWVISKLDSECHESTPFNAGNYKWKIKLYPKGKGDDLGRYISLYLALANPTALSPGSKVYAETILSIYDQKQSKYQSVKANYWFSDSSHENGTTKFISISNFTNQYLGYLVKDTCWVNAEVRVLGVVDAWS